MGWGWGKTGGAGPQSISPSPGPRRCQELLSRGATLSGWYHLCLPEGRALPVFCDMDTLGGGWLVSVRDSGQAQWQFCPLSPRGSQSPLETGHFLERFIDKSCLCSQGI